MAVKRGPDGNMIDEPTTQAAQSRSRLSPDIDGPTTAPNSIHSNSTGLDGDYDTPTIKRSSGSTISSSPTRKPVSTLSGKTSTQTVAADDGLDPQTQILGRQVKSGGDKPKTNAMDNPPVGWLVVITGPGRGEVLQLGYGRNTIGRGDASRLAVDFGDGEISRAPHCAVTYDPKSRKFYITHEEGVNLTYLNDAPVLQPSEITGDARITIGSTTLRLVPFCDAQFEWQDSGDNA